jgi:LysM repeat protein
VKSGDNLSVIAARHRTTVAQIKKLNGLRSDFIREGQVLKIPS